MITSAAYKLDELDSYPLPPTITVIPAKAGIHCDGSPRLRGEAIYQIAYHACAWKVHSGKSACAILHRSTPECPSVRAIPLRNATGRNAEPIYPITYDAKREKRPPAYLRVPAPNNPASMARTAAWVRSDTPSLEIMC